MSVPPTITIMVARAFLPADFGRADLLVGGGYVRDEREFPSRWHPPYRWWSGSHRNSRLKAIGDVIPKVDVGERMLYRVLANLVVLAHVAFILFAVLGGLLMLRWKRCAWIHVPAFLWAALIAFAGWVCPLTPLENWLRERGGATGYLSGFTEHYILPVLYPIILTRRLQIGLGLFVLGVNLAIYGWVLRRTRSASYGHREEPAHACAGQPRVTTKQ